VIAAESEHRQFVGGDADRTALLTASTPMSLWTTSSSKNAQPAHTVDHYSNLPSTSPSSSTFCRRQDKTTQRIELTKLDDYATPTDYSRFDHASAQTTDDDESTNNGLLLFPVTSSNARDFRRPATDKQAAMQKQDGATAAAVSTPVADRESQVTEVSIAVDYGCIVILVYYLQDSQLLNVKTVYNVPGTQLQFIARSVIAVLFRFELDVFELLHETCAIPDMTPVPKLASQALLVPFIMVVFVVIHTAGRVLHWLSRAERGSSASSALDVKLASGFITTLLFMYQKIGTTTFVVLNCVPVDNASVLYVDGTVTCFTNWQYAVLAYAAACVTPFCVVLLVAPSMLRRRQLSVAAFFAACLCPLPFLVGCLVRRLWQHVRPAPPPPPAVEPREPLDPGTLGPGTLGPGTLDPGTLGSRTLGSGTLGPGTLAVLGILQGPFNTAQ